MPVSGHSPSHAWFKQWSLVLCLAALCWVGNYTSLSLFFGIGFIFGSIASFLALALLGPSAAIFVAITGSCYTWLLWNHPYAILIFTAEVAVVSISYRLRPQLNLVFADLLYWLFVGIPLVAICYTHFLHIELSQSVFIGIKQSMNGVFNLLCANLIILLLRTRQVGWLNNSHFAPLSIKNLMFNLLLAITLIVGATPIIIHGDKLTRILEAGVEDELRAGADLLAKSQQGPQYDAVDLREKIAQLPLRARGFAELEHRDGTRISHGEVPQIRYFEAKPASISHLSLMIDRRQSSAIQRWNHGIYLYEQSLGDWRLRLGQPAAPLVNSLQRATRDDFILLTLLMLLAIGIAQVISRTVATPLLQLQVLSQKIGSSDAQRALEDYQVSPVVEYQSLLQAFSAMSTRLDATLGELREAKEMLEQRVEARTKDIQRLSLVASTTNNGVAILNNKQAIVWSNRALQTLLAQTYHQLYATPFLSLLNCREAEQQQLLKDAIQQETNFHLQLNVLNDHQKALWLELEWIRTTQAEHGHQGYIVIISDISIEKQVKEELTVYAAKLVKNNRDLDNARKTAIEAARIKSDFLASMSHEIRTPLNGVVGMLGLLSRSEQSEQQTHYTNLALHSAESLLSIINEILDFSKIEAGQLTLEHLDFDLLKLVSEFAETHAVRAHDKGIQLFLDATGIELHQLNSDPSRLRQILNNLISNAIKFTEQGYVQLNVRSWRDDQGQVWLECRVIDTGIGIEAHIVPHLFDAFTQADVSTTRKYGGTGLGLAITKQLCTLLEGQLDVASKPAAGSTFTATFPVAIAQTAAAQSRSWPNLGPINIGVVDRDNHRRDLSLRYLRQSGARVTPVDDYAALALAKPKWILTDAASLPELQHFIKNNPQLTPCRRLVLCSHTERTRLTQGDHWVNCIHLPSPLTPASLALLADLAQQKNPPREATTAPKPLAIGRLLLVEDNHVNQELARTLLLDMGYHVGIAGNGAEALDQLIDTPVQDAYQLILMDCQMPVMDGYTATHFIRAGKAGKFNQHTPIIAMTANALSGDKEKCLAAGMNDYLTKPLDFALVEKVLNQWLQLGAHTSQASDTTPTVAEVNDGNANTEAPVWDMKDALKRVRQREDRLRTLIELFLRDMPGRCEKIDQYTRDNNLEDVGKIVHEIKGVAGNISAKSLYQCAKKMEQACKNNSLNNDLYTQLRREMDAVTKRLDQYLKDTPGTQQA